MGKEQTLYDAAPVPKKKKKIKREKKQEKKEEPVFAYKKEEDTALEKVYAVSEYVELLNLFLRKQVVRMIGEISQFKRATSGHVYFTVKDKNGEAVIDCIMWKRSYDVCGVELAVGLETILTGYANIYPATGRLSFVADTVELVGEGALKKAYDDLKKKLEKEGAFDVARKRQLPEFIHKIGVVTSKEGAVIHDFINNLGKYGLEVSMIDSRVEGQQALKDLLASIRTFRKIDIEVLVIIRGGGSLESLQAFNNEALVREILDFPVPIVVGVGHHQDVPLLALAGDYMTSTPTAAAHLISQSWEEAHLKLKQFVSLLVRIPAEIDRVASEINLMKDGLLVSFESTRTEIAHKIELAIEAIRLHDPMRPLKLGYAIARREGKVIRDVAMLTSGDDVEVQLHKGSFNSEVKKIQ